MELYWKICRKHADKFAHNVSIIWNGYCKSYLKWTSLAVALSASSSMASAATTDMRVSNIYSMVGVASFFACEIHEVSGEVSPCASGVTIVGALTSNAWARGDRIYLTERIVRQCSDDELAFVIAHELSHIILEHKGSSIKNELEADTLAARLMYRSGFDVNSARTVLSRLQYARILGFPFSLFTHPANTRRLRAMGLALEEEVALNSNRLATKSDFVSADLLERLNSEGPVAHPVIMSAGLMASDNADDQRTSALSLSFSMLASSH
jgi:Peptidase family M48